jgi:hypothetical protein
MKTIYPNSIESEENMLVRDIRRACSTEQYIEYIVERINKELLDGGKEVTCSRNSNYVQFHCDGKKLFWLKIDEVENYRKATFAMLEKIIITNLECAGYKINKKSKYFKELWTVH